MSLYDVIWFYMISNSNRNLHKYTFLKTTFRHYPHSVDKQKQCDYVVFVLLTKPLTV